MTNEPKSSLWLVGIAFAIISAGLIWVPLSEWRSGNASLGWRETKGLIVTAYTTYVSGRTGSHTVLVVKYVYSDSPDWSPQQLTKPSPETSDPVGLRTQTRETLERFCDGNGNTIAYERQLGLKLYCGFRIAYGGDSDNPISASKYISGRVVPVYVDPVEPRLAVIEQGWHGLSTHEWSIVFSGLVVVLIVMIFLFTRWRQAL